MTTTSYPVTGQPISHAKWSQLFRRDQGIDQGMALTLSSVSDVATVAAGRAFFNGFELEVTSAHDLTIPAVSTSTVYTIGILYDPANESAVDGPLTLVAAIKSGLSIPTGGAFLTLWDITRLASQTLNLATVVSYATQRLTTMFADTNVQNPPANRMNGPAMVIRPDRIDLFDGTAWRTVAADTGWRTDGFGYPTGTSNAWVNDGGTSWRVRDGVATLTVHARRTSGSSTSNGTSGSLSDVQVIRLPGAVKPPASRHPVSCYAVLGGTSFGVEATVTTGADGVSWLYLISTAPAVSVRAGDVVHATATYLI